MWVISQSLPNEDTGKAIAYAEAGFLPNLPTGAGPWHVFSGASGKFEDSCELQVFGVEDPVQEIQHCACGAQFAHGATCWRCERKRQEVAPGVHGPSSLKKQRHQPYSFLGA